MSNDLKSLIAPTIKYCLKKGLTVRELLEAARESFVEEASRELDQEGQKGNVSRIAVMTGLQRPIVKSCLSKDLEPKAKSLAERVTEAWRENKRFKNKNGQPKILNSEGDRSEFAALVRTVSKDIHPGTVLFDLTRRALVEQTEAGLKLLTKKGKNHSSETIDHVAEEAHDFMAAMLGNLEALETTAPNYQSSSTFDNIDENDIPAARLIINSEMSAFQDRLESALSPFDLDANPDANKKGGRRLVVGLYSRTT
jgi:hypothetical protein